MLPLRRHGWESTERLGVKSGDSGRRYILERVNFGHAWCSFGSVDCSAIDGRGFMK